MKAVLVVLSCMLGIWLFLAYQARLDLANEIPGGTLIAVSISFLPFLSFFLHAKDVFLTDSMEAWLTQLFSPLFVPPTDDAWYNFLLQHPPDYADEDLSWNALPHKVDTADLVPSFCGEDACSEDGQHNAKVDLFFVGPSTHYSPVSWNSDFRDPMTRFMNREAIIPQQAALFNHVAKIYFPQIRQMTGLGYLFPNNTNAKRASDLAYSDVVRSFRYFLDTFNQNRPFLLASHSQGTEYVLRLLKEEIAGNENLKSRLVAAYLVGMPVYKSLLREMNMAVCESPTQVQCVISWQTYVERADPLHFYFEPIDMSLRKFHGHEDRVCVNPLSWQTNSRYVSRVHNKGAMHLVQWQQNVHFLTSNFSASTLDRRMDRIGTILPLKKHLVGARCFKGSLFVDSPPLGETGSNWLYSFFPVWRFAMFPGSNLHPYDYNLFWANIRHNAQQRVDAYFNVV